MPRPEDSVWAVPVAQVASRAGQSKAIDAVFPAPSGIGDNIVGIAEGTDVHVVGSFDSIVDGLVLTARIIAPVSTECTRCLKPINKDWTVDVTAFFPYDSGKDAKDAAHGHQNGRKDEEVDIIAGEEESEDEYPLVSNGAFADLEALTATRWSNRCRCSRCAARTASACARSAAPTSTRTPTIITT